MGELYHVSAYGRIGRFLSWMSLSALCVIMLYSMMLYVFWGRSYIVYLAIVIFCMIRLCFLKRTISRKNLIACFFCLLMYSVLDLFHIEGIVSLISYTLRHVFLVWLVILLSEEEKERLVVLFTRIFTVIVGISLLFYALYLLGVDLPYGTVRYESNTGYPDFRCYLFFLLRNEPSLIIRFQSVFLEPGHLGMVSALLLYVNDYSLRRPAVWVLFIALFVSLSLAAYVLLLIGLLLRYVLIGKGLLRRLVLSSIWLSLVLVLVLSYYMYDPEAAFSKRIVERFEYNEEKGISGNNRTTASFDSYYAHFFQTGDCLLGVGKEEFIQASWGVRGGGNSSYKTFIVQYGLIGVFFVFLFFSVYAYLHKSKLLMGLLFLYVFSFLQRPYALWEVELFLFIGYAVYVNKCLIISKNRNEKENKLFDYYSP